MKLFDIISLLEDIAPLSLQESYDNSGLLIGSRDSEITQALLTLDVTSEVVDEAIEHQCNLIIAHHPLIFKGLKRLTDSNDVEKSIVKAIKADIAIYAIHTNLDNVFEGVNHMLATKLGLTNLSILSKKTNILRKIVTFCPVEQADQVRKAMFKAGAGHIGNYDNCSFNMTGTGTFKGNDNTQPFVGQPGKLHQENEIRIETVVPFYLVNKTIQALVHSHPYEEVAYDIYPIENYFSQIGSGMIGELPEAIPAETFLKNVKEQLGCQYIKHNTLIDRPVKKVAVCGGSGSFLIGDAFRAKADIFITGDIKYHEFFEHLNLMTIVDAGHFETEQSTKELLERFLTKKFPNFALRISKKNVNPVSFL
jgi:dinuclear metal center YbgI/SA1388 family protein